MTEPATPPDATLAAPIVVTESAAKEQAGAALRDVIIVLSALPALIAVLGTGDVLKIVSFIASSHFLPALGVLVGAATFAWRQVVTRRRKARLVEVTRAAPDDFAKVVKF